MGASTSKGSGSIPVSGSGPPIALPQAASLLELTFQPAFDYDTDGCYPTPGIGIDGRIAPGLKLDGTTASGCRDEPRLANTNSYSRYKCNGSWCGIVYTLYFEKDQVSWGPGSAGHRHDWEHVVVWVKVSSDDGDDGELKKRSAKSTVEYVATSNHGDFTIHDRNSLLFDDAAKQHARVVYHKDGGSTHCFRRANGNDDPPENHRHKWQYPPVVGWEGGYPPGIREKISAANYGKANFGVKDGGFASNINRSLPEEVSKDFDVHGDDFEWTPTGLVLKTLSSEGKKAPDGKHDEL